MKQATFKLFHDVKAIVDNTDLDIEQAAQAIGQLMGTTSLQKDVQELLCHPSDRFNQRWLIASCIMHRYIGYGVLSND